MKRWVTGLVVFGIVASVAGSAAAGTYTVRRGDTLAGIARAQLGDSSRWREIANANGVRDPRRLAVGTVLEIPGAARTATPSAAQEPLAGDPSYRRRPRGEEPAVLPPARESSAPGDAGTSYPAADQDPIATDRETQRPYRPGRTDELVPERRASEAGDAGTSYPAEEQDPIVRRRARRVASDEPLATDAETRRRYAEGRDVLPERDAALPSGGATAYPGPVVENPGRADPAPAHRRFRRAPEGRTSFPVYRHEPLGRLSRTRGLRVAGPSDYQTTYPRRDREAVIADGKVRNRWNAPRWNP